MSAGQLDTLAAGTTRVFNGAAVNGNALYTLEYDWGDGLAPGEELWVTDLPSGTGTRRLVEAVTMPLCAEWDCKLFVGARGIIWGDAGTRGPVRWRVDDQPGRVPLSVTDAAEGPIFADDTHAYWSDGAKLWRRELCLPLAAPELVVNAPVRAIAVDDRAVYWIDEPGHRVLRRTKAWSH